MNVIIIHNGVASKHELPIDANGQSLFSLVSTVTKLPINQIRVSHESPNGPSVSVSPSVALSGLPTSTFLVKDLGPQVSYHGVYIIENVGPAVIWPLFVLLFNPKRTVYFRLAAVMWCFHYGKRLFETHFVHETMSRFDLLKNTAYHWCFAVMMAWSIIGRVRDVKEIDNEQILSMLAFFVFEFLNGYGHVVL
jgi:hypothetical protein